MSPAGPSKICVSCGADVSNAERLKDAQGRYICIRCADRLRARKRQGGGGAAAASAPVGGREGASDQGADIREFMKQAQQAAQNRCPSCGAFAPPDAIICLSCGYDARTQGQLRTKLGKARSGGAGGGGGGGGVPDNQALAGAASAVWVLIGAGLPLWLEFGARDSDAAALAAAPNAIAAFVLWVCWLVSYFGRNTTGKGVLVTIGTLIVLPIGEIIACAYFNKEGANRLLRWFAVAVAVSVLAGVVVSAHGVYQQMSEFDAAGAGRRP